MKEDFSFENIKENFTQYLEKNKLRKTPERYAILERIFRTDGFFDAEELFYMMQKDYRVSVATIYNTIDLLLHCNLIIKHHFPGQKIQYERHVSKQTHYHLICTECGTVKEFSDIKIRSLIKVKTFATFEPSYHSLYMYGLCKKCRPKTKKLKEKNN